eukprot:6001278-Pleurochrysis_carterae.AAC.1
MLRVVREVDSGHVVHAEGRRLLEPELTRGERDRGLLFRGPRDCSLAVDEDVARGGKPRRPVGIREAVHVIVLKGDVSEADVAMMVQVHEDPPRIVQQSAGGTAHGAAKHTHRVRHVRACLGRAIQQRSHQGH